CRSPCFDHRGKRNLAALTEPYLRGCQRVGRLINRRVHCFLPEQYDAGQLSLPSPFQWLGVAWRDFAADRDVTRSLSELRECTGRSSSTCGNIARTPFARGSKPSKRSNGFSQISRLHDLARRSVSVPSSAASSRSSPSVMRSTTAPWPSTRRDQRRLNSRSVSPMRVPPDQSLTAAAHSASASSGSRCRIWRVRFVNR